MINIRFATVDDSDFFYIIRNEELVRNASRNQKKILYDDHQKWYENALEDNSKLLFIILNEECKKMGYVRFDVSTNDATISIALDVTFRGKGYGVKSIVAASLIVLNNWNVSKIKAETLTRNIASSKAFQKAGFVLEDTNEDIEIYVLEQ